MKIGNPAEKPTPLVPNGAAPTTASTAPNGTAEAAGAITASSPPTAAIPKTADASAKIALSSTASTLLSTGDTAEFDAAKVDRISKAIDNGTFKINPEAIADKLIANAQELLSKPKP